LFKYIKKQTTYEESSLIAKLKINKQQFRDSKFHLFNIIIESLKRVEETNSRNVLLNKVMEVQILIKKGLLQKAFRKYKKLKEILTIKGEYDLLTFLITHSEILSIYNVSEDKVNETLLKNAKEAEHYLKLSKNLRAFRKLSVEVLGLHYKASNRETQYRNQLLDYLKHPLLAGEHMAKSDLARYVFYEVKCIIYMGIHDFEKSGINSLKCIKHLQAVASPLRDDYHLLLASYANFLNAQLYLKNIALVEKYMKALDALILKNKNRLEFRYLVKTFEMRTTAFLAYLSAIKNATKFEQVSDEIIIEYEDFKNSINPNFKAIILFYISKLYFIGGKLGEALQWSEKLSDIQRSNPTYSIIINGYLLKIMIHYDLGNLKIIQHLVSSAEYFIKTHNESPDVEQCFMKGINQIKPFHLSSEKTAILKKILSEIKLIHKNSSENKINPFIDVKEWLQSKLPTS